MSSNPNPLDEALKASWKHPQALREASEEVTAAVELAWAAARTVFGKQAKPQHAIDLAELFMVEARQRPPAPAVAAPTGLDASAPPRTRRTAVVEEPPRAITKAGRPARM